MVYPMYRQGNSRLMISVIECPCADVLPMLVSISIWQFLICIPGFWVFSLMICPSPLSGDLSNCCFSSLCSHLLFPGLAISLSINVFTHLERVKISSPSFQSLNSWAYSFNRGNADSSPSWYFWIRQGPYLFPITTTFSRGSDKTSQIKNNLTPRLRSLHPRPYKRKESSPTFW